MDGRTNGQRQNIIPPPMAGDNHGMLGKSGPAHLTLLYAMDVSYSNIYYHPTQINLKSYNQARTSYNQARTSYNQARSYEQAVLYHTTWHAHHTTRHQAAHHTTRHQAQAQAQAAHHTTRHQAQAQAAVL
ncbi:hypothetical protein DPMN_001181 [Dreissena polymorpha]|uniref:Uncharacterized protein n=1 Tax=Dreissena polymorpha TaxID=45954 RepID=A0A9D4RSL1_DREPO|nr:hypothetical protein DPMN_001181 [Dreissena polymorpha]